jgi:hypothetical protein
VAARPARPLHLEIEAAAILEHRDVLGLVFLASERAGDGAPSPADDGKGL